MQSNTEGGVRVQVGALKAGVSSLGFGTTIHGGGRVRASRRRVVSPRKAETHLSLHIPDSAFQLAVFLAQDTYARVSCG
jgi:hypothetical protein